MSPRVDDEHRIDHRLHHDRPSDRSQIEQSVSQHPEHENQASQ